MNKMVARPVPSAEVRDVRIGELGNSIGFLVRMTQLHIFEEFFAALGGFQLRPGEFSVVWVIHLNPGLRQGALAQRLAIKPAQMTKVIQRLETRGLVTRTIPADDRRSVRLNLTPAGEEFVAGARDAFFGYYQRDERRLTAAEFETLRNLLQKYTGVLSGGHGDAAVMPDGEAGA